MRAGRNGGGTLLFAQKGSQSVHFIILDQWEWLSVLTCVNAAGAYIPHFYIFKRKRVCTETTLKDVRTMLVWPCRQKPG